VRKVLWALAKRQEHKIFFSAPLPRGPQGHARKILKMSKKQKNRHNEYLFLHHKIRGFELLLKKIEGVF